jgi:21S rRNA (uridine2791-2'-O)-methyltransferase
VEVQAEVKRFLEDPDRGRPSKQLFSVQEESGVSETIVNPGQSSIDLERHVDDPLSTPAVDEFSRKGSKTQEAGKTVDVVLSDMSAPWEQTAGFWKRSLSDPYIRMMNTSGISFKDHAGSMVRLERNSLKLDNPNI